MTIAPVITGLRRPRALRAGDRVAVLSMSSPANLDRLPVGLDALRFSGFEPVVYNSARERGTQRGYLAGSDDQRAGDLRAALLDDTIAGVLLACGGYGSQRALEWMDWTGLDRVEPKVVVGYSDVTALLEALAALLGWASVMGPMVAEHEFAESYSFTSLMRCLTAPEQVDSLRFKDATTVVGGTAEGITCGGNLSLLAGSVGTPTSWAPAGGIVLLEDESEDEPRIDTMITHLRRSGYFNKAAAVVCGTFHDCGERDVLHSMLVDRLADLEIPLLTWANIGHGGHVQTYPVGVRTVLDADAKTLTCLDPPLQPGPETSARARV